MDHTNNNKWGIIYCPRTNGQRQKRLWQRIERSLKAENIEYKHVESNAIENVKPLMKTMIENGYQTIIIVGGDSALNNAINYLTKTDFQTQQKIQLGVIPNGWSNEFAHFWNFNEHTPEETIRRLKLKQTKKIDLGYITYKNNNGEQCRKYFLNCITIGLATSIIALRRKAKRMGGLKTISYIYDSIKMILRRLEYKMKMQINEDEISGKVMTVSIGNANGYGLTPNAVPYNGFLDASVIHHPKITQLIEGLYLLYSGKILNHKDVLPFRTKKVIIKDTGKAPISIDGRLVKLPKSEYEIGIRQEAINFLM